MSAESDAQVIDFISKSYQFDASKITRDTTFEEMGNASMKMIALLSVIENELDVEVPAREGMTMKTVGELCDRVAEDL